MAQTYSSCATPDALSETERERLILEHLPQVRLIARRIQERLPENISLDDLISTGVIGLISAIDHFDPTHNVKLKTYAEYKIRGAILDSLRGLDWAPRHKRRQAKQIEAAMSAAEPYCGTVAHRARHGDLMSVPETIENARLILDQWAEGLAAVLASMTDVRPDVSWQPGNRPLRAEGDEMLWWEQPFQSSPEMVVWEATPRALWEYAGTVTLKAAGLETVD